MHETHAPINEQEPRDRILILQPPLQDEGLAHEIARMRAAEVYCPPRDQFEDDAQYERALATNVEDQLEELDQHSDVVVVLGSGNQLLATASLGGSHNGGRSALVKGVVASPEHRGEGLGRTLMETIETIARQRGIARLDLMPSDAARDFYKKLGYGNPENPENLHDPEDATFYKFL